MTEPLRRFLLNREIAMEARRTAPSATKGSSGHVHGVPPDDDYEHTPKCNALKYKIEEFALQVKLAGLQRAIKREMQQEDRREEVHDQ